MSSAASRGALKERCGLYEFHFFFLGPLCIEMMVVETEGRALSIGN